MKPKRQTYVIYRRSPATDLPAPVLRVRTATDYRGFKLRRILQALGGHQWRRVSA